MDLTTQYGVDENNMIIEGNGRYEALKQLGWRDNIEVKTENTNRITIINDLENE